MATWFAASLIATMLVGSVSFAQALPDESADGVIRRSTPDERSFDSIKITSKSTTIELIERFSKDLEFSERITKVDGHDPDVISVDPLEPDKLRIRAIAQGVTTMVVTGMSKQRYSVEVFVSGDARLMQSVLKKHFPDSAIKCSMLADGAVLLTGYVTDNQTISQIMEVAKVYSQQTINHIRVGGPQQVQLRVKILEVQRSKLRTFGIDFQALTQSAVIASSPGSIAPLTGLINPIGGAPTATPQVPNNATLTAGFNNNHFAFNIFVQALKTEGLLKVMTEPVLVTRSGEAARLSDGGEFPIPIPAGLGTVGIDFREFGVILETLPIVISPTRAKLQVHAEVSDKDTANSIVLNGTTVPGLTKREVQSTVEMNFGDTMVVAGMISTRLNATLLKSPIIGEFPLIGAMFSKKTFQESETELIILITPEFGGSMTSDQVPPGGPGLFTTAPTDRELYRDGLIEVPKYGPQCGQDCPPNFSNRPSSDFYSSDQCAPGSPMITPGPSVPPSPKGLIPPAGVRAPGTIPPAPIADPGVSKRMSPRSTLYSKSKAARSSNLKDSDVSADGSSIQPAGFRKQPKFNRYSEGESIEKKGDNRESEFDRRGDR